MTTGILGAINHRWLFYQKYRIKEENNLLNRTVIMGRLTADPDYRMTPGGVAVANFRLAVERDYLDRASQKREADFIPVTAWRGLADWVGRYCEKGKLVVVDGRLEASEWTDRESIKRWSIQVKADNIYFAGAKRNTEPGGGLEELPEPEDDKGMGDWVPSAENREEDGE